MHPKSDMTGAENKWLCLVAGEIVPRPSLYCAYCFAENGAEVEDPLPDGSYHVSRCRQCGDKIGWLYLPSVGGDDVA